MTIEELINQLTDYVNQGVCKNTQVNFVTQSHTLYEIERTRKVIHNKNVEKPNLYIQLVAKNTDDSDIV